ASTCAPYADSSMANACAHLHPGCSPWGSGGESGATATWLLADPGRVHHIADESSAQLRARVASEPRGTGCRGRTHLHGPLPGRPAAHGDGHAAAGYTESGLPVPPYTPVPCVFPRGFPPS